MQLFPAEILHYAGGIDSFEKKWRCHPSIRNHQVLFSYPSASASHSQPAGHPWLSPWPSLDTPVAQSRSEDSGFGPWHLHSATPSETPQCGDSNSGGERMERMEGGWSMKRLEKDVMRQLVRHKKYQKHSNYICAYTRICLLHLCFESSTLKVCGRAIPRAFLHVILQSGSYPGLVGPKESAADSVCDTEVAEELASFPGNGSQHDTAHSPWGSLEEKGSFLSAYRWCMGNEYFLYVKRIERCGSSSYASLTQKLSFRWMHASPSTIVWLDILHDCMTVGFLDSRFILYIVY